MPPPRLIRPLRPCYPRQISVQIRWASDGPRDNKLLPARDGDPAQTSSREKEEHGGDDQRPLQYEANPSSSNHLPQTQTTTPTPTPTTSFWASIANHVLPRKKPDPEFEEQARGPHNTPSRQEQKLIGETAIHLPKTIPSASTERHEKNKSPAATPGRLTKKTSLKKRSPQKIEQRRKLPTSPELHSPVQQASGPPYVCPRCKHTYYTWQAFGRHVLWPADLPCWQALFLDREEASRARELRLKGPRALEELHDTGKDKSFIWQSKSKGPLVLPPSKNRGDQGQPLQPNHEFEHTVLRSLDSAGSQSARPPPEENAEHQGRIKKYPISGRNEDAALNHLDRCEGLEEAPSSGRPEHVQLPEDRTLAPSFKDSTSANELPVEAKSSPSPASDVEANLRQQLAVLTAQMKHLTERLDTLQTVPSVANPARSADPQPPQSNYADNETVAKRANSTTVSRWRADGPSDNNGALSAEDEGSNNKRRGHAPAEPLTQDKGDTQRLMRSSDHSERSTPNTRDSSPSPATSPKPTNTIPTPALTASTPTTAPTSATPLKLSEGSASGEMSEQSLLEELFPEANDHIQPHYTARNPYPKLDLPNHTPVIRKELVDPRQSQREQFIENFQSRSENITALQLLHCSTELAEMDFRRLVPKGRHIDSWATGGEFIRVIPGRDPLSLERLPFYYLVFRNPESALAYQKNAARLHKLSQLHQPSSIFSALPLPKGFLEDGEDVTTATSSYLLIPTGTPLNLNMVMKPYNPALRTLLESGGYKPIVPSVSASKKPLFKVLMHIDGYELAPADLYRTIRLDGYHRGIQWPLHNGEKSIARLRDLIDLRTRFQPISSQNPRAAHAERWRDGNPESESLNEGWDQGSASGPGVDDAEDNAKANKTIDQMIMNRVYNRWIVEFDEEEPARRFATLWNRRVLPMTGKIAKSAAWMEAEAVRMCTVEYLW